MVIDKQELEGVKLMEMTKQKIKEAIQEFNFFHAEILYKAIKKQCPNQDILEYEAWINEGFGKFENELTLWLSKEEYAKSRVALLQAKTTTNDVQHIRWTEEFESAKKRTTWRKNHKIQEALHVALKEFRFVDARDLYNRLLDRNPDEAKGLPENFNLDGTDDIYEKQPHYLTIDEYNLINEKYKEFYIFDKLKIELENFHFNHADQMYIESQLNSLERYTELKVPYTMQFAIKNLPEHPSQEQAKALAKMRRNLLVQARAGSGKTRVVAQKTALLLHDNIENPDEIMILAFNRIAAKEIRERIKCTYGKESFKNARTFHSLAYLIDPDDKDLLFDDTGKGISAQELSLFVQDILAKHKKNNFDEEIYKFFRRELTAIEDSGLTLSKKEYYIFRRNQRQATLHGENVKSIGEKWIADFLFEHGISYKYEKTHLWKKEHYHPDFSIYYEDKEYIIEHWGIDENNKETLPGWNKTWDEYCQEMNKKRSYCRQEKIILVETSIRDMRGSREDFEFVLKKRLEKKGIYCQKLPMNELYNEVERKYLSRFAKLVTRFIQMAKQQGMSPPEMKKEIQKYPVKSEKEKTFLRFANHAYELYENKKREENKIDYADFLTRATQKIHDTQGECSINIDHQRSIYMNDLRWIMIDEYQDFSPLFFNLIQAIRKYNPDLRLFCVGDDWQAINAFAGSKLKFFKEFKAMFEESESVHLVTNYRSKSKIVRNSNALMKGLGKPSQARVGSTGGQIQIEFIDDVWLELRESHQEAFLEDKRFRLPPEKKHVLTSKYLKKCYQIITSPDNIGKEIAVLSRTNRIYSLGLNEFKLALTSVFNSKEKKDIGKLSIETVHKFKGLDADIVILLRVCKGAYPLIHPDDGLYNIFRSNESDVLDDERRLFYVALSRAKEKIFILTEKGREAPFLDDLPVYDNNIGSQDDDIIPF